MATAKVTVTDHWRRYSREIEVAVERSLGKMGRVVQTSSRSQPTRYRIHNILSKLRVLSVKRISRGWVLNVVADDWREIFFEKGTYRHRRTKLAEPHRRRAGSELRGGVKAGHFLRKGLRAAKPHLIRLLASEMQNVGRGLPK